MSSEELETGLKYIGVRIFLCSETLLSWVVVFSVHVTYLKGSVQIVMKRIHIVGRNKSPENEHQSRALIYSHHRQLGQD